MKRKLFLVIGAFLLSGVTYAQVPADWQESVKSLKTLIKSNPQQASEQASILVKGKNKKNVDLAMAISRAYLDAKNFPEAEKYLAVALNASKKNPYVSILEGDIALEKNDPGTACQKYEQAIYYDKNCFDAYVKYAKVYQGANPEEAINKLEELKAVNPAKAGDVDKTIAKIYYQKNLFDKAADAYAKFIDTPAAKDVDITNYALALFLSHKFDKSLEIAQKGLVKNPRSAVFNRLAMYNNADLKKYDDAEKYADALFNKSDSAEFSYLDYKYYGYVLSALKKYKEAANIYKQAIDKDSTQIALWDEMASAYEEVEDYPQAINALKKYYSLVDEKDKTPELMFRLGKLYYYQADKLKSSSASEAKSSYALADQTFAGVSEKLPDSYSPVLWRARTNSAMDPETTQGLAKPYYEKVITLLTAKNDAKYNNTLVECYSYLGYYHLLKKQYAASKEYWNKVLSIDPSNATARKALSGIKA